MIKRQAFKFRLEPTGAQHRKLKRFCGCARFVFNHFLASHKTAYQKYQDDLKALELTKATPNLEKPSVRYFDMTEHLLELKKSIPWLKECHSQVLQQSLKDLERSFVNFFEGRADYPKFKAKGIHDAIRYPQGFKLEEHNQRIYLPKVGWIRYRRSEFIEGKPKNATVVLECGHWYVSVQTQADVEKPLPRGGEIAIDMGVVHTVTTDQGDFFDLPKKIEQLQTHIARCQKQLKNKKKRSKNRLKLIRKIAKYHHRIGCIRHNFLHQISAYLCKNHAIVYVEDLNIKGMTKSASGSIESLGKNVKAKSGLNRSILNQGWGELIRQLDYKLLWQGGYLVKVDPAYTSQTCPQCNHVSRENRRDQSHFVCQQCGYFDNADRVGAMNIKRAGQARLACEVNDISRQQQEPTEVTQPLLA